MIDLIVARFRYAAGVEQRLIVRDAQRMVNSL
jgi:hypothetical protein